VPPDTSHKRVGSNRRALRDYAVLERREAGIVLLGTEVKSVRAGEVNLSGSFARVANGEVVLYNLNVSPYNFGNQFNHEPSRPRKLLLHRTEIRRLEAHTQQKGHALIPLSLYIKRGLVKVELGVCKGKREIDKRETLRRQTAEREAQRDMARLR